MTQKIIDYLDEIESEIKNKIVDISNPSKSWNIDQPKMIGDIVEMIILTMNEWLFSNNTIKKMILPKCKHPKKMRDKMENGTIYCMSCNWTIQEGNDN